MNTYLMSHFIRYFYITLCFIKKNQNFQMEQQITIRIVVCINKSLPIKSQHPFPLLIPQQVGALHITPPVSRPSLTVAQFTAVYF